MKKEDFITSEEIAALIERAEARSLKEGDAQMITAVIKKMVEIEGLYKEGKITSGRKLRRLIAIPRPKPSGEDTPDE
jgi:hypothetical protein